MDNKEESEFSFYDIIPKIIRKKHDCPAIYKLIAVLETLESNIQNLETRINNLEQKVQNFLEEK